MSAQIWTLIGLLAAALTYIVARVDQRLDRFEDRLRRIEDNLGRKP